MPRAPARLDSVGKKRETRKADRVGDWAVSVRLNDGIVLYWAGDEATRQGQDWGRQNQAYRFPTQQAAEQYAADCATNSKAWEYRATQLPQPR